MNYFINQALSLVEKDTPAARHMAQITGNAEEFEKVLNTIKTDLYEIQASIDNNIQDYDIDSLMSACSNMENLLMEVDFEMTHILNEADYEDKHRTLFPEQYSCDYDDNDVEFEMR